MRQGVYVYQLGGVRLSFRGVYVYQWPKITVKFLVFLGSIWLSLIANDWNILLSSIECLT